MIKTFAYNEFDFKGGYTLNKDETLESIKIFVSSGGNLNLPVKYDDKFFTAFEFLEKQLGSELVKTLFANKYLKSPGEWILDEANITISQLPEYDRYWYRDKYKDYSEIISEGFKKLCQDYVKSPIYTNFEFHDKHSSAKIVKLENCNPLVEILLKLPFKEMLSIFINEVPNFKELLQEEYFRNTSVYEYILKDSKDDTENTLILFKNGVISYKDLEEKYGLKELIDNAISYNDFDFLNLLKKYSHNDVFSELDEKNSMYDSFLRRSNTPEMAKYLIDNGCQVVKKNEKYDSILFSHEYFSLSKIDTIKFIIDYKPNNYIKDFEPVFWGYLERCNDIEKFKEFTSYIVSKGFPLEKYDLFNVCPGNDINEKIKTCLELGANPNNCENLINKIIANRDPSLFRTIQKTKLLNLYSPDGIFYLLSAPSHTQGTLSLTDKIPNDELNNLTTKGKPAWFGIDSLEKFNKLSKKIKSFNQLDTTGHNWITHYYKFSKKDRYKISSVLLEMQSHQEKEFNQPLTLTNIENTSNLLHYGFNIKYSERELRSEFVDIVKSFNTSNLHELFSCLDEDGYFPTDYLLKSYHNKDSYNQNFWFSKLSSLLADTPFVFDFDKINKDGITLIDSFRNILKESNDPTLLENIEKGYSRYKLYNKLENKLSDTNKTQRPKI